MLAHDALDDGQADTTALEFEVHMEAMERSKELARAFHGEANPIVADVKGTAARRGLIDFDDRDRLPARIFQGVGQQVQNDLVDQTGIAVSRGQMADTPLDLTALGLRFEFGDSLLDD